MNENLKNLNKISEQIKKTMADIKPKIENTIKQMQSASCNLQPKLIKECIIKKQKAKVILFNDNSLRIEFFEKEYGEKFYNELK